MGFLSFLFTGPAPTGEAPRKPLRRLYKTFTDIPTDYTVIDVETSGLDACTCEILEIAAIKVRDNKETARYQTYIRPIGAIPKQASAVNGLTWRKLCDKPLFEDIQQSFFDFIGDDVLVGHNVGFDIKFIQTRSGIILPNQCFDTLEWSRIVFPSLPNYKLETLRDTFSLGGIPHSATGDCKATHQLLIRIAHSPEAQERVEQHLQYQRDQEQIYAYNKEQHDDAMAKKKELRKSIPSTQELKEISKQMVGSALEYKETAVKILRRNGYSTNNIHGLYDHFLGGFSSLSYNYETFFGAKTDGNLKYIVLAIPPDILKCSFVVTPSSMAEGMDSSRIFLHCPNDLYGLEAQIIQAFTSIQKKTDSLGTNIERPHHN